MTYPQKNTPSSSSVINTKSSESSEQLFLNRYRIGRNIASGAQGQVKLAFDTFTGSRVAIKLFKHRKMDEEVYIIQELKGHKAFVNLIQFASNVQYINGHGQSETVSAIVLEYASNGCLFDLVHFFKEFIGLQMIDALQHMKNFQISHRDIKLENIVLDSNFNLKVIDFGLAVQESRDGKPKSNVGTNPYAPPERFLGKEYCGHQFDIFSFGVFLFFLKFHYYPFVDNNPNNSQQNGSFFQFSNNRQNFWQSVLDNEKVEDINFILLLDSMLQQDPLKRPTIEDVRSHPFFKSQDNTFKSISIQSYFSMRKDIMNEMQKKQKKDRQNLKQNIINNDNKENKIQVTLQQNIQPQVKSDNDIINQKITKVCSPQETKLSSNQIFSSNQSDKQSSNFDQKYTIKQMDLINKNQNQLELDNSTIVENQLNRFKQNLNQSNCVEKNQMNENKKASLINNKINEQLQQPELIQNYNNNQAMFLISTQNCNFNLFFSSIQEIFQEQSLSKQIQIEKKSLKSLVRMAQSIIQTNLSREYDNHQFNLSQYYSLQQKYLLQLDFNIASLQLNNNNNYFKTQQIFTSQYR